MFLLRYSLLEDAVFEQVFLEQKVLTVLRVAVAGRHPAEEGNMERAARMSLRILAVKAELPMSGHMII